jgi:hypothetical protein
MERSGNAERRPHSTNRRHHRRRPGERAHQALRAPWVSTHPNLLGDDWTVCETLVGIHHVFTRDQLEAVAQDVWTAAWQKFEAFYYTKRPHSGFYREWPMH